MLTLSRLVFCGLAFAFVLAPVKAHSWTTSLGCEGSSLDGRVNWGTGTSLSTAQAAGGSQSCKLNIAKGSEGWPSSGGPMEFGVIVPFPTPVRVGEELWARVKLFVPVGFSLSTNTGMLKFIRFHAKTAQTNAGYLDVLLGTGSTPLWNATLKRDEYPPYVVGFEGRPGLTFIGTRPKDDVAMGRWEAYEVNVKVGTSVSNSRVRFWKNNRMVAEVSQISAVDESGSLDGLFLFTYWNGTSPQSQHLYVDDIAVTSDIPANRDSGGNPFIGGSIADDSSAPLAPSNLGVQ